MQHLLRVVRFVRGGRVPGVLARIYDHGRSDVPELWLFMWRGVR
jgi:hypothetical protein